MYAIKHLKNDYFCEMRNLMLRFLKRVNNDMNTLFLAVSASLYPFTLLR